MEWDLEIYKAIRDADAIIVCLSTESVLKEGYVQKEFKRALNLAEEKPDGTIYVIPLCLDECEPPRRFQQWQWLDYFAGNAHEKLLKSLRLRAANLKINSPVASVTPAPFTNSFEELDLYSFIQIPASEEVPYPFWIGKYPVTNAQYERFLKAPDYGEKLYWCGFQKFIENCIRIGNWGEEGWNWLAENTKDGKPVQPEYWNDPDFGISNPENPVVDISWFEANAYCNWLMNNWNKLADGHSNAGLTPRHVRLPLEIEWTLAAGGEEPLGCFPWEAPGKATSDEKEVARRANVSESGIGHTTPVNAFLRGANLHGVMDMAGNVWEWQANYYDKDNDGVGLRGGSWSSLWYHARVAARGSRYPHHGYYSLGFRVIAFPS